MKVKIVNIIEYILEKYGFDLSEEERINITFRTADEILELFEEQEKEKYQIIYIKEN